MSRGYPRAACQPTRILLHGTGNKPRNDEVDVSLVYGDYYFVEALMRLLHFDKTAHAIGL